MRERLAAALPFISDKLLNDACGGKIAALKLVMQISKLNDKDAPAPPPRFSGGRSYEDFLREEWQKEPVYVHPSVHPFPLEFHPPENPDEIVGPAPTLFGPAAKGEPGSPLLGQRGDQRGGTGSAETDEPPCPGAAEPGTLRS